MSGLRRVARRRHGWLGLIVTAAGVLALLHVAPTPVATADVSDTAEVTFTNDGVQPAVVGVRPGGVVRWINEDKLGHNTTHLPPAGTPPLWNSYEVAPGAVFTHTFKAPGTYRYFDFFDPDNPTFQGVVIVTTDEIPPSPTRGPTSTVGPTSTPRPATFTPAPTATPTQTPSVITGQIIAYSSNCETNVAIRECVTGAITPIRGVALESYVGVDVRVEGAMEQCPGGGRVLMVSSLQPLGRPCSEPTPTLEPTQTPAPGANLALGRTMKASMEVPGYSAAHLTDGNPTSLWYAAADYAWAYVDLGSEQTFNQVVLNWSSPHAVSYGIYVWNPSRHEWSGLYWTDIGRGGVETVSLRPTYGRYVLIYAVGSSRQPAGYALGELEVYGRERPNLALGSAVVASGAQECCAPWLAVDGDYARGWASPPGQANPWLRLHLPPATDISEIRLWWDQEAYPYTYSLVFYNGSQAPRQVIVPQAPGGLFRIEFPLTPLVADTLLIYGHHLSGRGFVGLAEVELFGPRLATYAGEDPAPSSGLIIEDPEGKRADALSDSGPQFNSKGIFRPDGPSGIVSAPRQPDQSWTTGPAPHLESNHPARWLDGLISPDLSGGDWTVSVDPPDTEIGPSASFPTPRGVPAP